MLSSTRAGELEVWSFAEIVKQAVDDNIHSEQGSLSLLRLLTSV
jgi:hypothetical protein